MDSQFAANMEAKQSIQQTRGACEARYAKAYNALDKEKILQSVGRRSERLACAALKDRLQKRKKVNDAKKMMLNESKILSQSVELKTPVPQHARHSMPEGSAKQHANGTQHGMVDSTKSDGVQTPTHLQKSSNFVFLGSNESSKIDHPDKSGVPGDSLTTKPSLTGNGMLTLPLLDENESPFPTKQSTLEPPNGLPSLFLTVLPTPSPIEHPIQPPTLHADEVPTFTGCTVPTTESIKSNKSVTSPIESLAHFQLNQHSKQILPSLKKNLSIDADLHYCKTAKGVEPDSDALQDGKMKPLRGLNAGLDDTDDSDGSFEEGQHQSTSIPAMIANGWSMRSSTLRNASSTSITPAPAVPSPAKVPITRDTSFSTRPSRQAARAASAAIAASRKGKGRSRGRGGSGSSAPAPHPTASAPPPPPPPPPRRSSGGASGHNKTWGFTTGPNGPWIEPPVIDDPKFSGPSTRKNLKKDVKEAIAQLEKEDPEYDPHAPARVGNQASMYRLRVGRATGQWPTSNVRGAVNWEEVQKRRLGVAVREAMRQAEEEEKAEEMEKQRKSKMRETAGKHKCDGEGLSKSEDQVETSNTSDWEGSFTTTAGLKSDYVDDKSDDGEDVTLVGEHSDNDDADFVHGTKLADNPRYLNKGMTQRLAAERKAKFTDPRVPSTLPTNSTDREHNDSRRYSCVPFSFRTNFTSHRAAERHENFPTAPQASSSLLDPLRQDCTQPSLHASLSQSKVATNLLSNMDTIAPSNSACATGDGSSLRMHDSECRNVIASGQIGGAADNCEARPAPRPYVFGGGDAPYSREHHNAHVMDLMERQLGLQLEIPPPAGKAFPAITGEWAQLPTSLMDIAYSIEGFGGYGNADAPGFEPFGEGPSGSDQHRQSPRPQ